MRRDEPRISIVIPALNEAALVAGTVAAARTLGFAEVIVADGGSEDATLRRAAEAGALAIRARRGRAVQMNAGAAAARGEALVFLHADTRLPAGAQRLIGAALTDPGVVGGCFRLRFDHPDVLLALFGWCSRLDSYWTSFGDQAFFVRRAAFEALGGFPDQPLMEDVAFRRRLRGLGRFVKLRAEVETSGRRFRARGALRQQWLNARLLAAYALGASPERLARRYR